MSNTEKTTKEDSAQTRLEKAQSSARGSVTRYLNLIKALETKLAEFGDGAQPEILEPLTSELSNLEDKLASSQTRSTYLETVDLREWAQSKEITLVKNVKDAQSTLKGFRGAMTASGLRLASKALNALNSKSLKAIQWAQKNAPEFKGFDPSTFDKDGKAFTCNLGKVAFITEGKSVSFTLVK